MLLAFFSVSALVVGMHMKYSKEVTFRSKNADAAILFGVLGLLIFILAISFAIWQLNSL